MTGKEVGVFVRQSAEAVNAQCEAVANVLQHDVENAVERAHVALREIRERAHEEAARFVFDVEYREKLESDYRTRISDLESEVRRLKGEA